MGYCPHCGSKVYPDEIFCVNCGENLPNNIADRLFTKKWHFKHFLIPLTLLVIMVGLSIVIYTASRLQINSAKAHYFNAEEALLLSDYELANEQVKKAIESYPAFSEARLLHQFTNFSVETLDSLSDIDTEQDQLQLILQAKNELTHYSGESAIQFQEQLMNKQTEIQLSMVKSKLEANPPIDDLPALLWEADSIQDPEAYDLVRSIRDQLITHSADQAYAYLDQNQFTLAQSMVENGLYYLPNDEKLTSLLSSIEKEKIAFEMAQEERLEQAFSQYEAEQEVNENDALDEVSIEFEIDSRGHLVVFGEITSVATIPIHAVLIHYTIFDADHSELESNEIFIYPETLYPGEIGQFDHIHFDDQIIEEADDVQITSITWLLN
ncbi:zinc-ribbon domain-containing protein [Amphibacillus sp. Q70]|uniref:zinc ribbon domain-containing protein n=1 Tax=Amphibacillus sp. Q70 TaxID=3453416 RepID=UPI003F87DA8E